MKILMKYRLALDEGTGSSVKFVKATYGDVAAWPVFDPLLQGTRFLPAEQNARGPEACIVIRQLAFAAVIVTGYQMDSKPAILTERLSQFYKETEAPSATRMGHIQRIMT